LYRQASQCQDAFTHTISAPQRGHELSAVVVGAVRNPAWQLDVGRATAMRQTVAPAPDDQLVSSTW
jgi:hypothetical protein